MSVHVSSWVWRHAPASGNALLVLLALADIANDEGIAWPSKSHLAAKTRLSLSTVKRVINALRGDGVIVADVSLGHSNVYRIVTDEQGQREPLKGQSDPGGQSEPGTKLTQGAGHSCDPGGGSRMDPYTSETRQDTSPCDDVDVDDDDGVDEDDIPKGSRSPVVLPRPFIVTVHMREWAARSAPSVNLDSVTSEFVAYWREGEGKGKRKKNWPLTWMNRMRAVHDRNVDHGWKPAEADDRKVIRGGRVIA